MFNKKGALELSINTIIVIVIAFVFLGLGLGFIQTQLDKGGDNVGELQEVIRNQIIKQLIESDDKLSITTNEFKLSIKEEKLSGIGIKNIEDYSSKFKVEFEIKPEGEEFQKFTSGVALDNGAKIFWDNEGKNLGPGDYSPVIFTLTAPKLKGSYLYKVNLIQINEDNSESIYDTANFFVSVN
jgi:hypothetical protein